MTDHIQQGGTNPIGEQSSLADMSPAAMMGGMASMHPGPYGPSVPHHHNPTSSDDLRFHGSELVMLYDYKVNHLQVVLSCFATIR